MVDDGAPVVVVETGPLVLTGVVGEATGPSVEVVVINCGVVVVIIVVVAFVVFDGVIVVDDTGLVLVHNFVVEGPGVDVPDDLKYSFRIINFFEL